MLYRCNCLECKKHVQVLFDFRYVKEEKMELYVIRDDGKDPRPTGYCAKCVQGAIGKNLDLMVSRVDGEKVSFVDFRRRDTYRYLSPATGTA